MTRDADALWCMLQAFRLTLTELDNSIAAGAQLFAALDSRTEVALPTLEAYQHQFATLTRYRDQMREVVARWGTMIGEFPAVEEPHADTPRAPAMSDPDSSTVSTAVLERRGGRTAPSQLDGGRRRTCHRRTRRGANGAVSLSKRATGSENMR